MPSSTRWRLNIFQTNYFNANYVSLHALQMASVAAGADLCTGGTASASSAYFPAAYAFDNDPTTRWHNNGAGLPSWIEYQFASAVSIAEYRLGCGTGSADELPKAWTFEYYDGATWNVVDTRIEQTGWTTSSTRTFSAVPISPLIASVIAMPAFDGGTSAAIDTTGATLLVFNACYYNSPTGVSDSKGNTWIPLTQRTGPGGGSGIRHQFYYVLSPTVGTNHTFTLSGSGIFCSFIIHAYAALGYESENGATGTGTSRATGSVTPTTNGSLIVAGLSLGGAPQTITIDNGLAVTQTVATTNAVFSALGYKTQTTAAAINPTWSWTTSSEHATSIAVFLPAAVVPAITETTQFMIIMP